jgi:hypothetical protein
MGWAPLRITGVLSYSLYLWHWPIYALLSEQRTGMSGWSLLTLRIAVSFAAAAISKVLVEDPVRFRATWARGRQGVVTLISVSVGVAAFWVLVPHPHTEPAVFSLDQFASTTVTPRAGSPTALASTTSVAANTAPETTAAAVTTSSAVTTTSLPRLLAPTSRVLMVGDSIAFDEWPAVAAAMYAGGIAIGGYVSPGAGLLNNRYDSTTDIDKMVVDFRPDLVLYQGSLWDWGAPEDQRAAYERFTAVVLGQGSRLAFITIPPLRAAQADIDRLAPIKQIMRDIAAQHPGQVIVLDSDDAWGPVFNEDVNGDKVPERKPDGLHVCPSGAAMYAVWLTNALEERFTGFVPVPPAEWAAGPWVDDPRYTQPEGICALLP